MTLRYVPFALSPDNPAENEPTAIVLLILSLVRLKADPTFDGRSGGMPDALQRELRVRLGAEGGRDARQRLLNVGELLERAELRQLRDELAVVLGLRGILMRELCGQQLQECLTPETAGAVARRGVGGGASRGLTDWCGGHTMLLLP